MDTPYHPRRADESLNGKTFLGAVWIGLGLILLLGFGIVLSVTSKESKPEHASVKLSAEQAVRIAELRTEILTQCLQAAGSTPNNGTGLNGWDSVTRACSQLAEKQFPY